METRSVWPGFLFWGPICRRGIKVKPPRLPMVASLVRATIGDADPCPGRRCFNAGKTCKAWDDVAGINQAVQRSGPPPRLGGGAATRFAPSEDFGETRSNTRPVRKNLPWGAGVTAVGFGRWRKRDRDGKVWAVGSTEHLRFLCGPGDTQLWGLPRKTLNIAPALSDDRRWVGRVSLEFSDG